MPTLASYTRMLSAYKPVWQAKARAQRGLGIDPLTVDELQQILAAWPYPKS